MQKEFIKCYVAGKKAGIIGDGTQYVLGHFFSAWNDGTQTSDRHGFLKFAGLKAQTMDEARAEETEQELMENWNEGYGQVSDSDICRRIVNNTPALKGAKYIGFDELRGRTPADVERILLS